jgi:hypothetical protein
VTLIDELADMQNGADPIRAAEQLTALLDLSSVGLAIRGARIVGRGSRASADLHLSDQTTITFESLRDVANPSLLTLEVAACTGATPQLKKPQAIRAIALLRALAEHYETFTADQVARDWGTSYLQTAAELPVDLSDQAARWEAFCHLERTRPVETARAENVSIAQGSAVLRHVDGTRLVRCGWFRDAIRAQDAMVSPPELAHRMLRVGWRRRGADGRIKASRPGHDGRLIWTFYEIPAGWEDER